jgi:rhodanese-related sulfurtransferase
MSLRTIAPQELDRLQLSGEHIELIDVRTPAEYRSFHVEYAVNAPLDSLDPKAIMTSRNGSSGRPLYVVCHRGSNSQKACERFVECGFDNVVSVEGGTLACAEQGLPIKRGRKAISLECQVRILAGFFVILGVLLGFAASPYFTILSAIMGAGLMYAGITDSCPMAMSLARMPWNRVPCSKSNSEPAKSETACCA